MLMNDPGWQQNYSAESGAELPASSDYHRFTVTGGGKGAAVIVRFIRQSSVWVGSFQSGDGSLTGVYATPSADHVCVVANGQGYWVSTVDPEKYEIIRSYPVRLVVQIADARMLLIVDDTELVAYGPTGWLWTTKRLSSDGIEIDRADAEGIWGRAWDASEERKVEFFVELKSGNSKGGIAY